MVFLHLKLFQTDPPLDGNNVTICTGGGVTLTVYQIPQWTQVSFPPDQPIGWYTGRDYIRRRHNRVCTRYPTYQPYSIWTVDDRDGDFAYSFNVYVVDDPVAPVMAKNPNVSTVVTGLMYLLPFQLLVVAELPVAQIQLLSNQIRWNVEWLGNL